MDVIKTIPQALANPRLAPIQAGAKDEVLIDAQYGFDGEWLPDIDPAKIGAKNFRTLQNSRYGDGNPEGVQGYTKINTTPVGVEDYTDYTEVDVPTRVTVAASTLTIADLDHDEEVYVYKDFGADYFDGDFEFQFDININALSSEYCYLWGLANEVDDLYAISSDGKDTLLLLCSGLYLDIYEWNSESDTFGRVSLPALNTDYYLTIKRDESVGTYGALYLYIYSDSERTSLMDSTTVTLTEKADFRYLYAMSAMKFGGSGGKTFNGTISNLTINPKLKSGFHFKKDQPSENHVLTQVLGTDGNTRVFQNTTDIPDQGNFSATALHEDPADAALGRFSTAPTGNMTYCNEKESCVWGGDEMRLGGMFMVSDVTYSLSIFVFSNANEWITIASGDFIAQGFKAGQVINVTGGANDGLSYIISKAETLKLTLTTAPVDQATGTAITITCDDDTVCTNIIDYTEAANNKLTTAGNIIPIGGGIDSYTKLMLHCDGADESTTFTDSSDSGHTVTANGDAQIDTAQAKFGTASGLFDGTGDYLSVPDSADWCMGTGAFTIDFWYRVNSGVTHDFFGQYVDANNNVFAVWNGERLYFAIGSSVIIRAPYLLSSDVWYHIAIIRGWGGNANSWVITLDGIVKGTTSTANAWPDFASLFYIGWRGSATYEANGHIDEFRVSKGIARWTENFTPPARAYRTSQRRYPVFSTRPLQGVKFYVQEGNTVASDLTGKVWNGKSFSSLTLTDGTRNGADTISLSKTGTASFASTVNEARPWHFEDLYLYAYMFELSAGSADLYSITVDADFQDIVDIWDGVYRQPIQCQFWDDSAGYYKDYTLEVNESSTAGYPIGCIIDGMTASDHLLVAFDERTSAIIASMLSGLGNLLAAAMDIKYWTGFEYVSVGTINDGTLLDATISTFAQTGAACWSPPGTEEEARRSQFGVTGYFYKITVDSTLTVVGGTEYVTIDTITGIPAQDTVLPFKFPTTFKSRAMLCGFIEGRKGNRVDYSLTNAADVWNGAETSMHGRQSLFFGDTEDLTCATQLYNRFGSNIYANLLVLKAAETYLLTGDGPEDYRIYPVSFSVGCPAPLTLDTAEVGFEMAEDVVRNVAIWLSASGPVIFDGAILHPVKKIKKYFDPTNSLCVNYDYIHTSRGRYDAINKEYNLIMPCGAGVTEPNVWLVYDLIRERWYEKDTGTAKMPLSMFPVVDENGVKYLYGGRNDGYMMRFDNGNTWDGVGIEQRIETGDFWPSNNIWDKTRIRRLKFVAKRITEGQPVSVYYNEDTDDDVSVAETSLAINSGTARLVRVTENLDLLAWSHGFWFRITTSSTDKGLQPIAWGIQYVIERKDT